VKVVSTQVEGITLEECEYSVIEGEYLILKPTILPETASNKNYTTKIENQEILEEREGKIFAKKIGSTFIIFTTEEGNKTLKVQVNVIQKPKDEIIIDESLHIDSNTKYLSNIQPETKVSQIKEKIKTNLEVKYLDAKGTELKDESILGTGSKIQIRQKGAIIQEYIILIYGDVNGDGKITSKDYMVIKNHIMKVSSIQGVASIAANLNKDDSITSKDYMVIKNHIMGIKLIEQN